MIRVTDLRKRFGNNEILKGITFEMPPQTVLGVIGASGSESRHCYAVSTVSKRSMAERLNVMACGLKPDCHMLSIAVV